MIADLGILESSAWTVAWSAFVGALFAFSFALIIEWFKSRKSKVEAVNRVLHTLVLNLNRLKNVKKQLIDEHASNQSKHFEMLPMIGCENFDSQLDMSGMDFLLSGPEPSILLEIYIEQDKYNAWLETLRKRNSFHETVIQPGLDSLGLTEDSAMKLEDVESHFGPRTTITIRKLTDQLIEHTETTIQSHEKWIRKLSETAKKKIRFQKFITIADDRNE